MNDRKWNFASRTRLALAGVAVALMTVPAGAQTLAIGLQDDPDLLDPHRARTFVGRIVFTSLCDKLVDITPELELAPSLATSWELDEDRTRLTMSLRDGAVFHDGAPIDADAVKANLDRARELPDSLRKSELASIESVEVVDALTVALNLSAPDAALLSQLSDRAGMMMSPASFDDTSSNPEPVCSGPYRFVERVQNDRIVLEKFADYWDADDYHFERLIFRGIPDNTVRFANLQSGDLQIIERIGTTDIEAAEATDNLTVVPVTGLGFQALQFNLRDENSPLADERVRRAFDLAIDRDVINEVIGAGLFQPAYQPFPPASFAYGSQLERSGRDVEAARALLAEAGHERVAFELAFGNNTTMQQVLELVQAMVSEAGFDITLRPTEFAALQGELREGRFQVAQSGWSGRVDPDGNIHQQVTCEGALNDGRYCNARIDELLEEARSASEMDERRPLYAEAQEILSQENPVVYLYYLPYPFAHDARLQGFVGYPDGMIRLKGVEMRD